MIQNSPTDAEIMKWKEKAEKWDKLDAEIGKFYKDEVLEGDEKNEFALMDIGEKAAIAFGYL